MDDCIFGWADKDELLNDQARWLPPHVTPVVDKDCDAAATIKAKSKTHKLTTADIWAASMNTQWFKLCDGLKEFLVAKEIDVQHIAFAIGSLPPNHGDCNLILFGTVCDSDSDIQEQKQLQTNWNTNTMSVIVNSEWLWMP